VPWSREIVVEMEEHRARDVTLLIRATSGRYVSQIVAAIDDQHRGVRNPGVQVFSGDQWRHEASG
jgi:hypothetical protein